MVSQLSLCFIQHSFRVGHAESTVSTFSLIYSLSSYFSAHESHAHVTIPKELQNNPCTHDFEHHAATFSVDVGASADTTQERSYTR